MKIAKGLVSLNEASVPLRGYGGTRANGSNEMVPTSCCFLCRAKNAIVRAKENFYSLRENELRHTEAPRESAREKNGNKNRKIGGQRV